MPFNYHILPERLRFAAVSISLRLKDIFKINERTFPVSIFNCGPEVLLGVAGWYGEAQCGPYLVLTHDIESVDGFRWIGQFAAIEESFGFRSSWNIVARRYRIDEKVVFSVMDRGHEVGLHGIWHNGTEAFLRKERLRAELTALTDFMVKFKIKGFRSPSWYRTGLMFDILSEFFLYDASCPDIDMMCPAGNGGVGVMRPFRMENGLIEMPCTLPFEFPLYLGVRAEGLLDYWMPKIDFIKRAKGILLVNTHPEPNYSGNEPMLRQYRALLNFLSREKWQAKIPFDIAREMRHE